MFKDVLSMFPSNAIHRLALVASIGSNILKTFDQEFAADMNSKDAAIDALVQLLNAYKGKPCEAPVAPPAK